MKVIASRREDMARERKKINPCQFMEASHQGSVKSRPQPGLLSPCFAVVPNVPPGLQAPQLSPGLPASPQCCLLAPATGCGWC